VLHFDKVVSYNCFYYIMTTSISVVTRFRLYVLLEVNKYYYYYYYIAEWWRKLYNEKLHNLPSLSDILRVMKMRMMRLSEYVCMYE
jgi:hypothetical protein